MIDFEALFKVSYGMYIVSSGKGKSGNGFISNSVFQVTAEPVQFAACCNKENFTADIIKNNQIFSISILKQDTAQNIISVFGYKSGEKVDKFQGLDVVSGETACPIVLNDAIAYIECKLVQTVDVGSHYIFIGEVVKAEALSDVKPLTYEFYREVKKGLAPKNAPTYVNKKALKKSVEKVSTDSSKKYKCAVCGYIYDPEIGDPDSGIEPGTPFEQIPDDWACPVCGAEKEDFIELS